MATARDQQCQSRHYYVSATIDNRYRLVDFIGAGGMACVYRAKEIGAPHEFALKFLKDEYHNMDYLVEYFEEEASSMQNLAHPNIVRFYRFIKRPDYSYIIMDFVDGFALSQVLKLSREKKTQMPLDEVVRVFVQIARALDTIHRENFVHRDIKPGNVLIDRKSGQAFLTDLGIASATGTKIEGAGTIAYMAPEQSVTWTADARSDIYAYGILLYELLTGKRPFNVEPGLRGSEAEADLLRKHKESPVPDVTRLRSGLPSALNGIIAKAMAKDPDDRYQSVIKFAQDVHRVLSPKLSADLQEFASVQHRQIAAPTPVAASSDSQNMLRLAVIIGIAAIILAGILGVGVLSNGGIFIANTPTPTPTATPPPTLTPTENPIEGERFRFPFLSGLPAIAEPDNPDALIINASDEEPFEFLRIGAVDGFRLVLAFERVETDERYGVAFRMVDSDHYHAFLMQPDSTTAGVTWQVVDVVEGVETVKSSGVFETMPSQLTVGGAGNFFEIRSGSQIVTYISEQYPQGSVALYIESGTMQLNTLELTILGDAARDAVRMTPTPSIGLAHPLRFIEADVEDMIATNNQRDRTVDCPTYISIYDSLNRHFTSDNATVRAFAASAQTIGTRVYQRCSLESPDTMLEVTDFLREYTTWGADLQQLLTDIQAS